MLKSENNTGIYFFQLRLLIQRFNKNQNNPVSPHNIFTNICPTYIVLIVPLKFSIPT